MTEQEIKEKIEELKKERPSISDKDIEEGISLFKALDAERVFFKEELQRVTTNALKRCANVNVPMANTLQVLSDTMLREAMSFSRSAAHFTNEIVRDMQEEIKRLRSN